MAIAIAARWLGGDSLEKFTSVLALSKSCCSGLNFFWIRFLDVVAFFICPRMLSVLFRAA